MSRKSEKFFDAVTCIREDLIEEAQNYKFRKNAAVWIKYVSLAACIVLVMSIGFAALLPRGGSSGGANSSAPAAPQDSPCGGEEAPPLYEAGGYDGSSGAVSGDAPEDNVPGDAAGLYQFTAVVIEVREQDILAEPIEYDSHDQVLIPFSNLELPPLAEGDWITVTCSGGLVDTLDPPAAAGVLSIEKIEPGQ